MGNREYISPVSSQVLQPASHVITFIDDIYDIYERLRQPGHILQATRVDGNPLLDSLVKLLFILNWRAIELVVAQQLAAACNARHFLFATKHPCSTFYSLLFEDKPVVYLSHHITFPRELLGLGQLDDAKSLIDEISEFARCLRSKVTLFEPTTIDEARFSRIDLLDTKKPLPALSQRWSMPVTDPRDMLYDSPQAAVGDEPLFGQEWRDDALAYLSNRNALTPAEVSNIEHAAQLLMFLDDEIRHQINARDHALVEQSQFVAAYRPWMRGQSAGGVRKELQHHASLGGRPVIVHPTSDETTRQRVVVRDYLRVLVKDGKLRPKASTAGALALRLDTLQTDDDFWQRFNQAQKEGQGKLGAYILQALGCEVPPATKSSPLASDPGAMPGREVASAVLAEMNSTKYTKELESSEVITELLSPEQAAQRVVKVISKL